MLTTTKKTKKIKIERTKKGHPALWECGGGKTNTGSAQIIANPDNTPKTPVYVRNRGSLACDNHALFIISCGDIVVMANHHREDFEAKIYKIASIQGDEATLEEINSFENGEWDFPEPNPYPETVGTWGVMPIEHSSAWLAAVCKATCYHCREPHFITNN